MNWKTTPPAHPRKVRRWSIYLWTITMTIIINTSLLAQYPSGSPVAINGKLKLAGNKLSNECGNPVQLRGMSTHGVQWFEKCYTSSSLDALTNSWKIDIFRIAMYVDEQGYSTNPSRWRNWIDNLVNECGKRGIYCLIDWHILHPGDPNASIGMAREFWSYMSNQHKDKKHVLYEICNEPNGVDWNTVKRYADDIIPRIRANDPNTIIIVGTPNYSQDVDKAADNKLNYPNIMYTLHFYSGTHTEWLRTKGNTALSKGIALFVTEFGTSKASGDGGPFLDEADKWINWMAANNISWINWSFADKAEVSAALSPGACGGNWNSTTTSGTWVKQKLTSGDNFNCQGNNNNQPNQNPSIKINSPTSNSKFNINDNITIDVSASDPDGSIVKVEFYEGSNKLGEISQSPYQLIWRNLKAGNYTLTAKAVDNKNATSTSQPVSVTIHNPMEIEENAMADNIIVSPNPAEKEFSILHHGNTNDIIHYELFNEMGQKVWSGLSSAVTENEQLIVDCGNFPKGLYFLTAQINMNSVRIKLGVQ